MARFGSIGTQYFDNAGDPLVDGHLYFYESGTTAPKITFADVNLSIPNSHPVQLSAAGRQPNIFFEGSARAILTDEFDVQIEARDPVGGEFQEGAYSPWNSLTIYDVPDIVIGSDGNVYVSIANGNQKHDPTTSPAYWTQLKEIRVWNPNEIYIINDLVQAANGFIYASIQNANLNHAPPNLAWWTTIVDALPSTGGVVQGNTASPTPLVRITQLGTGDALRVEAATRPFVIEAGGRVRIGLVNNQNPADRLETSFGNIAQYTFSDNAAVNPYDTYKSRGTAEGIHAVVQVNDVTKHLRSWASDGANYLQVGSIIFQTDAPVVASSGPIPIGTAPSRFSVNVMAPSVDGGVTPGVLTERIRVTSTGNIGFSNTGLTNSSVRAGQNITGNATAAQFNATGIVQSDVASAHIYLSGVVSTAAAVFVLANLIHFRAGSAVLSPGAGSSVTNQIGFGVGNNLLGASSNFGFRSDLAAAAGVWGFFGATAQNAFGGMTKFGSTAVPTEVVDVQGNVLVNGSVLIINPATPLGYGPGVGTSVVQATNKATTVAINRASGQITMNNASLAANTAVGFVVTNTMVTLNDTPVVTIKSGNTANAYHIQVDGVQNGQFVISLRNMTAGALAEAVVLQFNIIRGTIT